MKKTVLLMLALTAYCAQAQIISVPVSPTPTLETDRLYLGYQSDKQAFGENLRYRSSYNGIGFYDGTSNLLMGVRSGNNDRLELTGRLLLNATNGGIWLSSHKTGFLGLNDGLPNGSYVGFYTSGKGWNTFNINTGNGYVGIGTQAPDRPLTVQAATGNSELMSFMDASGTTQWHFNLLSGGLNIAESAVADYRIFIKDGGNVGIGKYAPQTKLDVAGPIQLNKNNAATSTDYLRFSTGDTNSVIEATGDDDGLVIRSNTGKQIAMANKVAIGTTYFEPNMGLTVNGATYIGDFSPAGMNYGFVNDTLVNRYNLWVEKGIVSEDFALAHVTNWSDFVFDDTYQLPALPAVEAYVRDHKHLPGIPSEADIKKYGYTVHDMNQKFMMKIEELTLYVIAQQKEITELKQALADREQMKAQIIAEIKEQLSAQR